ncbi:disulfide bond formation protein B [Roseiterribacter gracilis]|uniref:Dihydroneopterin aldolase n=1 Tax=Roseiterribacter gracilis TaxID=2812848 RepID=A0A8S8X9M6_9PROT|nr:dihydroneopterin aldolase [Rhodospirillales bacterium TMPK1]
MIRTARAAFALLTLLAIGALGFALVQQYAFGLPPCEFCIWQRWPWGLLLALSAASALAAPPRLARPILVVAGLLLLVGAAIAAFHAGVEQHWWEGPTACSSTSPPARSLEALRAQLSNAPIVRCDQIAWSLLGLSMAGYNFLVSLAAALVTLSVARRGFGA